MQPLFLFNINMKIIKADYQMEKAYLSCIKYLLMSGWPEIDPCH